MINFLSWTAWRMEPPPPYGFFHFSVLAVGLLITIVAAWLLRRISCRAQNRIILGIGVVLVALELYKQLFSYHIVNQGSYDWWIFPFQLCSIPIALCLIAPLLKKGSVQRTLYDFLLSFSLLGAVMALAFPHGMMHSYWSLTLHAFIWHFLILFVSLLLGLSRSTALSKSDFGRATILYLALCAVALTINLSVLQRTDGQINMFYLGPQIPTSLFFGAIATRLGWQINAIIYMAATILGASLFYCLFRPRSRFPGSFNAEKRKTKKTY